MILEYGVFGKIKNISEIVLSFGSVILGASLCYEGSKNFSVNSKLILILAKDDIFYHDKKKIGDPACKYLSWSDVVKITTRPHKTVDIAIIACNLPDSIFVPKDILPVSFDDFHKIVSKYFISEFCD